MVMLICNPAKINSEKKWLILCLAGGVSFLGDLVLI